MSVHPSHRLPATPGDTVATPTAEAAGGGDLFNALVSGLAGSGAAPSDADAEAAPMAPAIPGTATAEATDPKAVPESVEQLLALVGASRSHASGKSGETPSKAEAKQKDAGAETADEGQPVLTLAAAAAPPPQIAPASATAPQAISIPLVTAAATGVQTPPPAALPATAPGRDTALTADPALPAAPTAPQADPASAAQTAAAQPPAPADSASAGAVIRSLLAELAAPSGERRRSDHALPTELSAIAAAAPGQADAPGAPSAAAAPVAPAQPQGPSHSAAPAAPIQGLVIERQLDLAHQQDWIDQLARDISSAAGGGDGSLRFRLNPEHLGSLHVEIAQSHHGAAVRFSADSEAARAIIADAQPRLVAEARAQGVRISESHVDLGSGGAGDPRRQAAAPAEVQVRTARSLQGDAADGAADGKPTPRPRDLYA